jgi:uncharacterized protein
VLGSPTDNIPHSLATYDVSTIHGIVNSCPVAHVSFVPDPSDPKPACIPMLARIGSFKPDGPACCYIHGATAARMFKTPPSTYPDGMPVCIVTTKVDGIVLTLTPYNHNIQYRSAAIHGRAFLLDPVEDAEENLFALRLITDGVVPGRWEGSRTPPDKAELTATRILRVEIDGASAKQNSSGVKDDKKDLKEEIMNKVWTGVLPVYETIGRPQPGAMNKVKEVPPYVTNFVEGYNQPSVERESKAGGGAGWMGFLGELKKNLPF